MIKILTRLKKNFVQLAWIKKLITAKIISSSFARILEWAIYTVYAGVVAFVISGINTWDWSQWMSTIDLLAGWFAITILSAILQSLRRKEK